MSVSLINGHIDPDTNRMTDNEIIKVLECQAVQRVCGDCPLRIRLGKQKEEIERLKKGWKADVIETSNIKAEAIKEFAEKVKNSLWDMPTMCDEDGEYDYVCMESLEDFIDNLVKEMAGAESG